MKAEIKGFKSHYFWIVKSRNGITVARSLCFYTRKDNTKRGLVRFIHGLTFGYVKLGGVTL